MLRKNKYFIIVIFIQCLFFIAWALYNEGVFTRDAEKEIIVKIQPVDPRDYLSGQYMRLGYDFSRPRDYVYIKPGNIMWAELKPEGEFYVLQSIHSQKPENISKENVLVKGVYKGWVIEYGIEKYFVPEGTDTPNWSKVTAKLSVHGKTGRAKLKQAYLDGKEWP